ncbi:Phytochromobilin:ferredoxin oxidoreductase, chloroplastic [Apostasia shenzhenica]|uniref:Phytochromobilin:ferredoxin oxidoreductase, chloroplastic n=1 Tax=Apostasia shenzhenica TaxID=1088818 RepID=A0A2I0BGT6_9ASPA|nr:Phytochromobilin:ferredoxin oxidoreductase, chloroplastic [Apostasia shenzhenica]
MLHVLLKLHQSMDLSSFSYLQFVQFAVEQAQSHTILSPLSPQEKFNNLKARDGNATFHMLSFRAPKVRHFRSLCIEARPAMQVLDFAVLPKPEFDLPIFCANFFSTASLCIVVLDLNPLYDVELRSDYKDKYYKNLMPLYQKYAELLPWGGKVTGESLSFFSPIVVWSKFNSSRGMHQILYAAFKDYFMAWLNLMEQATKEADESKTVKNCEAQHKYLTWRAEKDPGYPLLKRLIGEDLANDLVRQFLFEGVDSLGTKSFLDYFPEYSCEDGSISQKRSVIGKVYNSRPWDAGGELISGKDR